MRLFERLQKQGSDESDTILSQTTFECHAASHLDTEKRLLADDMIALLEANKTDQIAPNMSTAGHDFAEPMPSSPTLGC